MHRQMRSVLSGVGTDVFTRRTEGNAYPDRNITPESLPGPEINARRYWLLRFFGKPPGSQVGSPWLSNALPHRWLLFIPELTLDTDLPIKAGSGFETWTADHSSHPSSLMLVKIS